MQAIIFGAVALLATGIGGGWLIKDWEDGAQIALIKSEERDLESRNARPSSRSKRIMFEAAISKFFNTLLVAISIIAMSMLARCASKPVIQSQAIEKPMPVYCKVEKPAECKDA